MMADIQLDRRTFLRAAALGLATAELSRLTPSTAQAQAPHPAAAAGLGPLKTIKAGVLEIGYHESGPAHGTPVVLLHGFPFDPHAYADVAPILAAQGCRVVVPYLRGFGKTRFLDAATPRSGQQAALGADLVALLDALAIPKAVLAGYDWGGRAACAVAALSPDRCAGLVSVNGYAVLDLTRINIPAPPERELPAWYQFYFLTERGKAGYTKYRRETNKLLWKLWSPKWQFDDATFERTAPSFDNPDYIEVTTHSYRHRYHQAAGDPAYAALDQQLARLPVIGVPTITLDGADDAVVLPSDGTASAAKFSARKAHHIVPGAGHNLPQEAPRPFADAVLALRDRESFDSRSLSIGFARRGTSVSPTRKRD
jgi:pimeloyl-ACP methyl ester carboxylesterase